MQASVSEAFADRHAIHGAERRIVAQYFRQAIERDTAVEMMHMVDANVGA